MDSGGAAASGLRLLVVAGNTFHAHPIGPHQTLRIGRDPQADICVKHKGISREHAIIRCGANLEVEDLGSSNGTRLGDQGLPAHHPRRLAPGDVIEVPGATLVLQRLSGPSGEGAPAEVVADPAMARLYEQVDQAARNPVNVLVLGETGVGKEVVAARIHRRSPRAGRPFLCLNCAALPEALLESELFGYERGAFTGADQAKPGLLEAAQGGTVFLDEIGDMPSGIQGKLLRAIESRAVMRLGGLQEKQLDLRFVAATNRDLEADVRERRFRADLYYRLNGFSIEIPPLRQRPRDLEALAAHFIARACESFGRSQPLALSAEAKRLLLGYGWPGNARELKNVLERAVMLCNGSVIEVEHLPAEKLARASTAQPAPRGDDPERGRIAAALETCGGNQTLAAKQLGISRRTLVYKLGLLGFPRPRKPRS
jgi:two-component system response regulator AtoC